MSRTQHVADRVDDLLHGLLTAEDSARVVQHCLSCPDCQAALDSANKRFQAFQAVPVTEASSRLVRKTLDEIDAKEKSKQRWQRIRGWVGVAAVGSIAASALLLLALHLYFRNLAPSPFDLQILGQNRLLADTNASLRIRLTDRTQKTALPNVPVEVTLRGPKPDQVVSLCSFTTGDDGSGEPRFQVPDWDGPCELIVTANPSGTIQTIKQAIHVQREWKLMLSSDKPIYQPGQEIHLRSLALGKMDLKPAANREVTFIVTDPKGNVIFKRRSPTGRFGIASADCLLAHEINDGDYNVVCQMGETTSKLTVEVRKYVLPKFKIHVELDKPYYQPGQTVRGRVQADYFFGKPVAAAKVVIQAASLDVGPQVLQELKATTNADGFATFDIILPVTMVGRPQDHGDARLAVRATVTDSAGQEESKAASRIVTAQPIHVDVLPEMGSLVPGVANTVFFVATYPDGRPAQVKLTIPELKTNLRTNSLGVAHLEVTETTSQLDMTVAAFDDKGVSSGRKVSLPCGYHNRDFLIRPDKAVYSAGETLKLLALGGGKEPIFLDFIKDGQTVLTDTIRLADGKGEYQHDIPADLTGTVQVCAYRFGDDGLPVRKMRVLYVKPSQQLDVRVEADKKEYRPREKGSIALTLVDQNGQPTPGALSLAVVDESVFAVQSQRPGLEKTFHALEQELLKPVYAIYPWSPDQPPDVLPEEWRRLEQALFASTATTIQAPQPSTKPWMIQPVVEDSTVPSPHGLEASSFERNAAIVEETRERGLAIVKMSWISLVTLLVLVGGLICYVALWVYANKWVIMGVHFAGGFLLVILGGGVFLLALVGVDAESTFEFVGADVVAGGMAAPKSAVPQMPNIDASTNLSGPVMSPSVRVRDWFPETLIWKPQLVTDEKGRVSLPVEFADVITTWRMTVSGVTADGRLGSTTDSLKVFQPFFVEMNLPVALTRGDETAVPVVVYNYLDKPQTVELTLDDAAWFERQGDASQKLDLGPGEVKSLAFKGKVKKVGQHTLTVTARAAGLADAVKREIVVEPDGRRVEAVTNGTLQQPAELSVTVPDEAIEGSPKAFLKLYPSSFSQLVEGLENIFQMPSGCFEQTSSTTYPNILALDYLMRTGKSAPAVEAKARQFIHLGYQRLLGFEVIGGGFDWFGRPPANRTLTAYGLMEFRDMARVHDVDANLIERTRRWLLNQQKGDGSWDAEGHGLHDDPTRRGQDEGRLTTTAYIAWAVFDGQQAGNAANRTLGYLRSQKAESLNDPYTLALVANALLALNAAEDAKIYLDRLDSVKKSSEDGKLAWWELPANERTAFFGAGIGGQTETTAMAILALLRAKHPSGTATRALTWLVKQKDNRGTWHSTQATVLALKALIAGTDAAREGDVERRVLITWQGKEREVVIPPDQAEVMQLIDLSGGLKPGTHQLVLREKKDYPIGYQLVSRHHVPGIVEKKDEPLTISLAYDRTDLVVGETITATATVTNRMPATAPMVMLDLPIPGGFAIAAEDLGEMVQKETIARFQVNPRSAIVYLRELVPGKPLTLQYRLRATMPVKVTAPSGWVYEYYDTQKKGGSQPVTLTIAARE